MTRHPVGADSPAGVSGERRLTHSPASTWWKWLARGAGTLPDEKWIPMGHRHLQTEPPADLVGDVTDQLSELGEMPDEAETEEMDAPVEWLDPWREN